MMIRCNEDDDLLAVLLPLFIVGYGAGDGIWPQGFFFFFW